MTRVQPLFGTAQGMAPVVYRHFRRRLPWLVALLPLAWSAAASAGLAAGPMAGPGGPDEAAIWLMTDAPARVEIEYWPEGEPQRRTRGGPVEATADPGLTARVDLAPLAPGTGYGYRVLLDGEPVPVEPPGFGFETPPAPGTPPRDFLLAAGSCAYQPDWPFDPDPAVYGIFDAIADQGPDLMLWLGDSVYYRDGDFAGDGAAGMNARWAYSRRLASLQRLLRTGRHLAIWDDHDYGPNNSNGAFDKKDFALDLFKRYWANGTYGLPGLPGVFSKVSYEDLDLFLLDDRFYRDDDAAPPPDGGTMLGTGQIEWLKGELRRSRATFKVIANGSRLLAERPSATERGGEGWHNFPKERAAFLDWLEQEGIEGVIFLSGDMHYTHLMQRERPGAYTLTELTCSPLTSRVHPRPFPVNEVPGTLVAQRNFCTLAFAGPPGGRVVTIMVRDAAGNPFWSERIPAAVLSNRPTTR